MPTDFRSSCYYYECTSRTRQVAVGVKRKKDFKTVRSASISRGCGSLIVGRRTRWRSKINGRDARGARARQELGRLVHCQTVTAGNSIQCSCASDALCIWYSGREDVYASMIRWSCLRSYYSGSLWCALAPFTKRRNDFMLIPAGLLSIYGKTFAPAKTYRYPQSLLLLLLLLLFSYFFLYFFILFVFFWCVYGRPFTQRPTIRRRTSCAQYDLE